MKMGENGSTPKRKVSLRPSFRLQSIQLHKSYRFHISPGSLQLELAPFSLTHSAAFPQSPKFGRRHAACLFSALAHAEEMAKNSCERLGGVFEYERNRKRVKRTRQGQNIQNRSKLVIWQPSLGQQLQANSLSGQLYQTGQREMN